MTAGITLPPLAMIETLTSRPASLKKSRSEAYTAAAPDSLPTVRKRIAFAAAASRGTLAVDANRQCRDITNEPSTRRRRHRLGGLGCRNQDTVDVDEIVLAERQRSGGAEKSTLRVLFGRRRRRLDLGIGVRLKAMRAPSRAAFIRDVAA